MKYLEFQKKYRHFPIIYSRDLVRPAKSLQVMRNQIRRWQAKWLIEKLRRGIYILSAGGPEQSRPDANWIANRLYEPSYLSLETALAFYGLIPEKVTELVSITPRKTMQFENKIGHFVYRHVKPVVFRGFQTAGEGEFAFFMAEPEKAVVDFLYFHLSDFKGNAKEILKESYRFQNIEGLKKKKLLGWCKLFQVRKLTRVVATFCAMIDEES